MIYHILLELTCCIIKYMTDVMNSLITVYLHNGFGWEVNTDRYSPGYMLPHPDYRSDYVYHLMQTAAQQDGGIVVFCRVKNNRQRRRLFFSII